MLENCLQYISFLYYSQCRSDTLKPYKFKMKDSEYLNISIDYLMGRSHYKKKYQQLKHDIETLDAKAYLHYLLEELIEKLGYKVEVNFAEDGDGENTVLFEGQEEKFEIKANEFLNSCYSYIDYGFNKIIEKSNRVQSDYFNYCFCTNRTSKEPFEIHREFIDNLDRNKNDQSLDRDKDYLKDAHSIEKSTEEDTKHDDSLMKDDDLWK